LSSGPPSTFVVIDLGFGDAGKGLLTDYLVRRHGAGLVVRFNGGAQAGHNVVTDDGRHHTFSQLGSGTFVRGVKTHLSRNVVVHPTALLVEAEHLERLGERDVLRRVSIDPMCRVTTPIQQAAGRLRELLRGDARHGSSGVGFGETVGDSLEHPALSVFFHELKNPKTLLDRLHAQRDLKLGELGRGLDGELEAFSDERVMERWLDAAGRAARAVSIVEDEALTTDGAVVLEGAQGVLIDERFGFHPFVTWSRTTPDAALDVCARAKLAGPVERIGLLRTHAVRHGPGPLPTEDARVLATTTEPHNGGGPWQGPVRKGWPDLVLLDYALRASGGVDSLAVTHLDALARFSEYRVCEGYDGIDTLALPSDLAAQERLSAALTTARPRYASVGRSDEEFCKMLEGRTGLSVRRTSSGMTARTVRDGD
jgi:adenylosuccinate synthase